MNASHTTCTHAATAVARLVRRMNASLVMTTDDNTEVYEVPNHPTYLVCVDLA